ncbi:gluconokinase [Actinosynnema sp. NPDC047251]|uniref:Gluconokinase n=1 Tax=Saccharothrix espanaensis (strain ATCC 51144 / DSM 44229 / JCM 9112 / NBRC 15066 / NRRL 15764) TaxID=1179773 RepID=K0K8X0_SACES|nr:gluconokinase [Saccharothrix espanaensis]CCH33289.1 Gluconate kinase [Saccharothrix espanaensis DSM 44229]
MPQPIVVMGVSGSGKTTAGTALARRLAVPFADADDFHPPANIAKMAAGVPLDDADRAPWLRAVGDWLAAHPDGGVVTCSALKRTFRDGLRAAAPAVRFVHLAGDPEVVRRRVAARSDHFMPVGLVASQFATLEPLAPDEPGLVLDLDQPVDALVHAVVGAGIGAGIGAVVDTRFTADATTCLTAEEGHPR